MSHRLLQLRLHSCALSTANACKAFRYARCSKFRLRSDATSSIRRLTSVRATVFDSDSAILPAQNAETPRHVPVMLSEVLTAVQPVQLKVDVKSRKSADQIGSDQFSFAYASCNASCAVQTHVDGTLGAAGHAAAVLRQHPVCNACSPATSLHSQSAELSAKHLACLCRSAELL